MSDRNTADDLRGETNIPLPLQGHLEHGWFQDEYAGLKGNWEILMATEGGEWPNALVDREQKKFIISTYPRGRHEVTEVDIGSDPDIGIFMIVDMAKHTAFDWFALDRYDMRTPEKFNPSEDFDENSQTPILISEDLDRQYGRAVIFWRPSTQYLDKVVNLAPFESRSPRLATAADKVIRTLGLPRGKPKSHRQQTRDVSDINPERAEELHDKFEYMFRDNE